MSTERKPIGDDPQFQAQYVEFKEALEELKPNSSEDLFWTFVLCYLEDLWSEQ